MKKENFVLYRLPDTQEVFYYSLSLGQGKGAQFVFHTFDNSQNLSYTLTNKQKFSYSSLKKFALEIQLFPQPDVEEMSKEEYLAKCNFFIDTIRQGDFEKLILSRIKSMNPIGNPKNKFLELCDKYPSAFVYLANFDGQTMLGASPERLVQIHNNKLKTVALAGTKAVSDMRDWTLKEQEEHRMVVDYIVKNLHDLTPSISETETIRLGEIEHLQTQITASLPKEVTVTDVCSRLHPTPAVCGIPKDEAQQFILENEGYDRRFYTGYFGVINDEKSEIFVNLRCAQLYQDAAAVYVGGGLLAASDAELEWQETEWKAKALF